MKIRVVLKVSEWETDSNIKNKLAFESSQLEGIYKYQARNELRGVKRQKNMEKKIEKLDHLLIKL